MISIIVPTYNYVCTKLVTDLSEQAQNLKNKLHDDFDYEILVADDGSDNIQTIKENRKINHIKNCRLLEYQSNIGRALIRNWLIEQSHFKYLLIIDSDALVCTNDFIEKYWNNRHQADFICGTIQNPNIPCPSGYELRYYYEQHAEKTRKKKGDNTNPYFRLSTFNLFFNKEKLGILRFDPRCKEYGYEDALMGLTLKERGLSLIHINNPLIHNGIDSNASFLSKTEAAMRTLSNLDGLMKDNAGTSVMYHKLKKMHILSIFRLFFLCFQKLIRANLLGHHPSLFLFQLYKLGYYSQINQ